MEDYLGTYKNRPRTVVFYGRVSTEHEQQISALENQMEWYANLAERNPNWTVAAQYIDESITGTQIKKRPSFMQMMDHARQRQFDLIVTRELSRSARNTVHALKATLELKQHFVHALTRTRVLRIQFRALTALLRRSRSQPTTSLLMPASTTFPFTPYLITSRVCIN